MDFLPLISALITGLISVITALTILRLQEWRHKKRMLKALYSEVESNLGLTGKILPLAEHFSKKDNGKDYKGTYFDLQHFYTYSYEDFRRSGYLLSLNHEARQELEEVYTLISSHNHQTDILREHKVDFSSHEATISSLFPRIGGYSERLEILKNKLKLLQEELRCYA